MPPTGIRYVFVMSWVLLSCCVEVMDPGVASLHAHPHAHAHANARKMNGKDGPRRRTGAGGAPPRGGRPVDHDPLPRNAGSPFPFVIAAPAAWRRRGASAREVASGVVRGRTVRPARAPGRFPVVMLTRIKAADSNRGAFRPLPASGFAVRVGRRRESNPRPVIPSHMLCPTELLRWRNEPRAPNDTRRAMVSFGAPDRHPEPEPLFGPRSHYPMDGPRVRRPSWFVRRVRHAPFQARRFGARMARRQASGRVRGGTRYRGRAFASAPVAPGGRGRPTCQRAVRMHGHPGPGQQKSPGRAARRPGLSLPGDVRRRLPPRVSRSMSGRPSSRVYRSWAANRSTATVCLLDRGCMPPGPALYSGAAGAFRSLRWVRFSASPYSRSGRVSAPLPEGRRSLLAAAEMSTGATRLPATRMPSNRGGGDCTRAGKSSGNGRCRGRTVAGGISPGSARAVEGAEEVADGGPVAGVEVDAVVIGPREENPPLRAAPRVVQAP